MSKFLRLTSGSIPILAQIDNGVDLSALSDMGILGVFTLFMVGLWWRERQDRISAELRERRILLAMTRYNIPKDDIDQLVHDVLPVPKEQKNPD